MFQGLRTAIYGAKDIQEAKQWYSTVLGIAPYFDQPFYVGFNVGGYELGLDPDTPIGKGTDSAGPVAYWGVADAKAAYDRLLELGATGQKPPQAVGDDILIGTVLDPFGNVLGIVQNPHFKVQEN